MPPLVDSARLIPQAWRFLYAPFQGAAESLTALSDLNRMYDRCRGGSPEAFIHRVLGDIGFSWTFPDKELALAGSRPGPLLVLSNHPMGGPEAMLLLLALQRMRPDYRVMANFLMAGVAEIQPRLLLVDPFGSAASATRNVSPLRQTLQYLGKGGLVGAFPAGEVSAWRFDEGRVADRDWNPQLARLAIASGASVLPAYFDGGNGLAFQLAGMLHPTLRTLMLPRAVMKPARRHISLKLGSLLSPTELKHLHAQGDLSAALRRRVYALSYN
jgi:putative hemolysin